MSSNAVQLAAKFKAGWNAGNTLEAIGGETYWGKPMITPQLIQAVKAAGFTSIGLMAEVHFYDPSQFALPTADASWGKMYYYWGNGYMSATDTRRAAEWGDETWPDQPQQQYGWRSGRARRRDPRRQR